MDQVKFQCKIENSDPDAALGLEIWLDDQRIYHNAWVKQAETVEYNLADDEGQHSLRWILTGKTNEHTKIDEAGNIVKDALISVTDVAFDDIQLGHSFNELATYQHNFNGNGADTVESFNNKMGCNGTVTFEFSTPFYLWLLENM
jgi:hypothetical protein